LRVKKVSNFTTFHDQKWNKKLGSGGLGEGSKTG
jgi:hypothetical protein